MQLDAALEKLAHRPAAPFDLAELALALARDEYPDLDVAAYLLMLAGMAHEARRLVRRGDLKTRVERFRRCLFFDLGFRGNARDYYDPRNSYLNDVIERRMGIPITLSIVAIAIGKQSGLDVRGVGLPGHFIVKAVENEQEILFDPFHGGRLLEPADCEVLVAQCTSAPFVANPETLREAPLQMVLLRMLNNLRGIYAKRGDNVRLARVLGRMCQLQPADANLRRELGAALTECGEPGRAIDHFRAALQLTQDPDAAAQVRDWLARAEGEVSRWN